MSFLNRIPARRAGQPWRDDAQALPEQTQGNLESLERMRQTIITLSEENARLKDECTRLAGLATANIIERHESPTLESVRDYLKRVRVFDDVTTVVTDLRFIIGEK